MATTSERTFVGVRAPDAQTDRPHADEDRVGASPPDATEREHAREPDAAAPRRAPADSIRVAVALVLLVLAVLGPFVAEFTAQAGARYGLAGAIVDDGTIRLDGHRRLLAADDWAERDGHVYSDKAPGQIVLAVPLYAAARAVGSEPATDARFQGDLGAW
ncbi:hypothetical protein B7486_69350, partial [cyanobacterium TDX16]